VLRGLGDGVLRDAGECLGVKLVLTGSSRCRVRAGLDHHPTLPPGVMGCLLAGRPGDGELLESVDTAGGKPCISVTTTHADRINQLQCMSIHLFVTNIHFIYMLIKIYTKFL